MSSCRIRLQAEPDEEYLYIWDQVILKDGVPYIYIPGITQILLRQPWLRSSAEAAALDKQSDELDACLKPIFAAQDDPVDAEGRWLEGYRSGVVPSPNSAARIEYRDEKKKQNELRLEEAKRARARRRRARSQR